MPCTPERRAQDIAKSKASMRELLSALGLSPETMRRAIERIKKELAASAPKRVRRSSHKQSRQRSPEHDLSRQPTTA